MNTSLIYSVFFLSALLCTTVAARAEVVINGTRIVFEAQNKETVVQLKNNGKSPLLVQAWLDTGNPKSRPGEVNVPFVITPPVIRIDPAKGQALRILKSDGQLAQDKETLFWFNVLEIPPKPTQQLAAGENLMQLAFRSRIKMFYRPDNLKQSPQEAYKALKFSLNGTSSLRIKNDSPYFITFKNIEFKRSKNSPALAYVGNFPQRMVSPGGELVLPVVKKGTGSLAGASVSYAIINDYGGETVNEQILGNNI